MDTWDAAALYISGSTCGRGSETNAYLPTKSSCLGKYTSHGVMLITHHKTNTGYLKHLNFTPRQKNVRPSDVGRISLRPEICYVLVKGGSQRHLRWVVKESHKSQINASFVPHELLQVIRSSFWGLPWVAGHIASQVQMLLSASPHIMCCCRYVVENHHDPTIFLIKHHNSLFVAKIPSSRPLRGAGLSFPPSVLLCNVDLYFKILFISHWRSIFMLDDIFWVSGAEVINCFLLRAGYFLIKRCCFSCLNLLCLTG